MRRAKAYGSSCSQVIIVYLHPFRRNSLFCSQKSPKNRLKEIFLEFKVIDVDKSKKPVTSACYYKQHVCTYHRRQNQGGQGGHVPLNILVWGTR